jgi:hypothetical protein
MYDGRVKSEILFCKWGRLGIERSESTNIINNYYCTNDKKTEKYIVT